MRGIVWRPVIRPSLRCTLSIILAYFVLNLGAGYARNGPLNYQKLHPNSNFPEHRVQREIGCSLSSGKEGYIGDTSRHLLQGFGEEEETHNGKEEISELYSREFEYGGEVRHPLDLSPEAGSALKVSIPIQKVTEGSACTDAWEHPGYADSCAYVRATPECSSGTLIEYTEVFYCFFAGTPILAYAALILFLAALFYTLGHTAHHFFCVSMDKLSLFLKMPPTLAGVTLLPFGNGAPDVFASIAAFVGHSGQGQVGLNSILGGAMFVSSVVAGSVSLAMIAARSGRTELDRRDFLRDVGFFLITLAVLTGILFDGKIHFWEALLYVSIYALYVSTISAVEYIKYSKYVKCNDSSNEPLIVPRPGSISGNVADGQDEMIDNSRVVLARVQNLLPGTVVPNYGAIHRQESVIPFLRRRDEQEVEELECFNVKGFFWYCIGWPLTLPRRLTIPLIADVPQWSKSYAVCSVTLAPVLLAMVWDAKDDGPLGSAVAEYIVAGITGTLLGGLSLVFLKEHSPPERYRVLWAAGGFIMSMVWFYVIAVELVAALVALGAVWKIDPAIFGLTVLAWGNSIGDLMANLALVSHGDHRMQTAFSGCYAGPMFNTLIGIGVSFALASWKTYPAPFAIPEDSSLFLTIAFLVIGLLWSLAMLLSRDMQPTKTFGVGLLILYISFLATRLAYALDIKSFLLTGGIR